MFKTFEWRTNKIKIIEENEKKILIKEFDVLKPALIFTLYNIACFVDSLLHLSIFRFEDYYFPSVNERIRNEISGREILSKLGIKTPEIYYYEDKKIFMEYIEGVNLLEFYEKTDLNEVYRISKIIGLNLKILHDHGYTFMDCRVENFIVRGNDIYRVDLEFFTKATEFRKISDIITFDTSVLGLDEEKCMNVLRGFHEGYGRDLTKTELTYVILFSSIYPLSLKEGINNLMNRTKNVFKLIGDSLRDIELTKILKLFKGV